MALVDHEVAEAIAITEGTMPAPSSLPIDPAVSHLACAVDTGGLAGGNLLAVLAG